MFEASITAIGIPTVTPQGHQRRTEQLRWTTVVREVLQRKRPAEPAVEAAGAQ